MNRYIRVIGPAVMAVGLAMVIFGIICLCCAGSGIGRLEDVYYYLDINLYHGRFSSGDAGEVLSILDDIGLSEAVIGGFERFSIYARWPFVIVGVIIAAAGAVLTFKNGIEIPENTVSALGGVWNRVSVFCAAAVEWARMKLSGRKCPVCGEKLIKGAAFCGNCGAGAEPENADGE